MKYEFNNSFKAVFVIAFVVMMTSCSFKTFYNQLDNVIPYYVEGMVSLDSMLEDKVAQRTLVLINWHRDTQLKKYVEWLRAVQRDADKGLTKEMLRNHVAKLYRFWKSISLKVDEEMVLLLPLLNAEQYTELYSNIDNKNDEFREEYVEVKTKKRITQYTDRIIDNYETWLGNLTEEQEVSARQAAAKLQSTASYRLERRLQWQRSIKRILDTNNPARQKAASLRQFFMGYRSEDNVAMNRVINSNKNIILDLTLEIAHSMTGEQKAHFSDRTNEYIRMFQELAKER